MSTEPPPPVNPYAPSEELAHGDEPAREPAPAVQRRPSRALAIIFSVITYPLAGVGLYVLGRRNAVAWMAAALGVYAAMIASVIARAPAAFLVAFALTLIVWLSAIVNTCVARPGAAPPRIGKALLAVVLAFVAAARRLERHAEMADRGIPGPGGRDDANAARRRSHHDRQDEDGSSPATWSSSAIHSIATSPT